MAFDIAVIGIGCSFPGASSIDSFLDLIKSNESHIVDTSKYYSKSNKNYMPFKGVFKDAFLFDAELFELSAADAELLDPQHRIFFQTAFRALESAGYKNPKSINARVGVYASCGFPGYLTKHILNNPSVLKKYDELYINLMNDKDFIATRLSYIMNFTGPSISVQCGCSSSLMGIHLATQALLLQECDIAVTGGTAISFPIYAGYEYTDGSIASMDGKIYSFDEKASGTVRGDGCGVVVLKRLEDALADGNRIFAIIKGSAVTNDGKNKVGFTAPGVSQQVAMLKDAVSVADIDSVDFIEAHATGTKIGDPIEITAIHEVFKKQKTPLILTSVKPHIGHLDVASGIAGFIKTCLSLYDRGIPHTLNFSKLNPMSEKFSGMINVLKKYKQLSKESIITAGVTSLGMGGTNVHVILQTADHLEHDIDIDYLAFNLKEYCIYPGVEDFKKQNDSAEISKTENLNDIVSVVWQQILGVPEIKPNDNFFELGGNSFAAVQCLGLFPEYIRKKTNVLDFLTNPTFEKFLKNLQSKM